MGKKGTGESKGRGTRGHGGQGRNNEFLIPDPQSPIPCAIATVTKSALVESTGGYTRGETSEFDNMLPLSL